MDDRIAEIREALERWKLWKRNDYEQAFLPLTADLKLIRDAARELVDLLDSDALIIRRDEDGKWDCDLSALDGYPDLYEFSPKTIEALRVLGLGNHAINNGVVITSVLDALASSQGVEP